MQTLSKSLKNGQDIGKQREAAKMPPIKETARQEGHTWEQIWNG